LFLLGWHWEDVPLEEEVGHLTWDFSECFFGKLELIAAELPERNKLNDVPAHIFSIFLRIEWVDIRIKHIHRTEVSVSDPNNDDRERQISSPHNLINGLLQVINDAICNNQQYLISLILRRDLARLTPFINSIQNPRKVCRSV